MCNLKNNINEQRLYLFIFLSTYKVWEEIKDLLFEAVLLLMSASKWKSEVSGVGNGKRGGKG